MKLPGIDYSAPVQSSADAIRRPYDAAAKLTETVAEGMTRYGQELVKTQQQRAAADLSTKLAALEGEIGSKRYVSTQYLRDALGEDFNSLPGDLRSRLTRQQHDVVADETYDADRDDIPMWEVASALYEKRARRLVDEAGSQITVGGWRSEFQTRAQGEVSERRMRVDREQMRAMDADLRLSQGEIVEKLTRAGSFGDALSVVRSSQVFTPGEKEKLAREVEVARVTKPIFDAIQTKDVAKMRALREGLASDEEYAVLDESRRTELANSLDVRIKAQGLDALARAEEERVWKEAGGHAGKAVALARGIEDTELADEVGKRLQTRINSDHAARVAADSAPEGRLEIGIYQTRSLPRTSEDYLSLSDEGKARVEAKLESAKRADLALAAEGRRVQNETDDYLRRFFFGTIPPKGKPGADQASIDIDQSPLFAHASPKVREELKAKQREVQEEIAKDGGVNRQQFLDKVTALGQRLGYGPKTLAQFKTDLTTEYDALLRDAGVKGTVAPDKVNALIANAIPVGDSATSAVGHAFSSNTRAWQAKRKGEEFHAFPEQPEAVRAALEELQGTILAPAAPARTPPVEGAVHITNGTQGGWLLPGKPMPDGWRKD